MRTKGTFSTTAFTYTSALRRLLSLVDFERMAGIGAPLLKQDLARVEELVHRLGDPQRCAPVVHIAGTKGKGSVAAMVASMLTAAGLRTGLFTSPHLYTFRERIRLDCKPVSEELFAHQLDRVWPAVEAMGVAGDDSRPTTFETLTAMAFDLFREQQVDVQVIEVGLGGRLDSTNVAHGDVAVITSLSLDHTAILGDALSQIAAEKAGIIKPGARVVLAPQPPEATEVVLSRCSEQGASVLRLGHEVTWRPGSFNLRGQELRVTTPIRAYDLSVPLLGDHQRENAAAAVAAVEALEIGVSADAVAQGLRTVEWPGRFQVLSTEPNVVVDGAHNSHSMARLRQAALEYFSPGENDCGLRLRHGQGPGGHGGGAGSHRSAGCGLRLPPPQDSAPFAAPGSVPAGRSSGRGGAGSVRCSEHGPGPGGASRLGPGHRLPVRGCRGAGDLVWHSCGAVPRAGGPKGGRERRGDGSRSRGDVAEPMTELTRNGRRRVVATGMGAVSPLGRTVEAFWDGLVHGRSGIGPMTLCDPTGFPCRIAGEVKGFDPQDHMDRREARRMARFSQLAIAATQEAVGSAWLEPSKVDSERVGVLLGNGNGGFPTIEEGARMLADGHGMQMSPFFFPMILPNMASANVRQGLQRQGFQQHGDHGLRGRHPGHRRGGRGDPPGRGGCDAHRRHRGGDQPARAGRLRRHAGPQHP